MKKLCLIIPSLQSGGMERVMSELAGYFAKKVDLKVHLILYSKKREVFFSVPSNIVIHKPDFVFNHYTRFTSTLKTLFFLRKKVREIKPDTILSFGEYWNSFVLLALWRLKVPIYISDRCQPNKSLGPLHDRLRQWLYPKASGIIAQTTKAKEVYEQQKLNGNIRVIGNPIFHIDSEGAEQEKKNIVLTVGRLIKSKHHDRLIKIFKNTAPPNWKLIIVGGDAQKQNGSERLEKLVKNLGMDDKVELTGTVSDIEPYYRKSKIFAFTSSSEGFPNVIGEAMSAGLPVIAYDCVAGPSDLVDEGKTGFLIPPFEDLRYAKKMELLINDIDLRIRMGRNGRKKISDFVVDRVAEKFYAFIFNIEQSLELEVSEPF